MLTITGIKRVMACLYEQGSMGTYIAILTLTGRNENDMNTTL